MRERDSERECDGEQGKERENKEGGGGGGER